MVDFNVIGGSGRSDINQGIDSYSAQDLLLAKNPNPKGKSSFTYNPPPTSSAQPATLSTVLDLAYQNNTDITDAKLNIQNAQLELDRAKAGKSPTVDLTLGGEANYGIEKSLSKSEENSDSISANNMDMFFNNPPTPSAAEGTGLGGDINAGIDINLPLSDGGANNARVAIAEKQLEQAKLNLDITYANVKENVTTAYNNLQGSVSTVASNNQNIKQAEENYEGVKLQKEVGLELKHPLIEAKLVEINARLETSNATNTQNNAYQELLDITGSSSDNFSLPEPKSIKKVKINPLEKEVAIEQALGSRNEIANLSLDFDITQQEKKLAEANKKPQINGFAGASAGIDLIENPNADVEVKLGVEGRWKLFDGGDAKAEKQQGTVAGERANNAIKAEKNNITNQVNQAYNGIETAEKNIRLSEMAITEAKEVVRLAENRYIAGVDEASALTDAQTDLNIARNNKNTAITAYNNAAAQYERVVLQQPIESKPDQ